MARASGAATLCGLSTARANGPWTRGCSQQAHHRPNQPHQAFTLVTFTSRHHSKRSSGHPITAYYSIYRPRKDERLNWPGWLTCGGWFTHISFHPSAAGQAQDSESSPAKDRRSTTVSRKGMRAVKFCSNKILQFLSCSAG